jgi:hypothetical protein
VLILTDGQGRQLSTPAQLEAAVVAGRVRYALLGDACSPASGNARTGCLPVVRWARTHGVDVSRAAGQPHRGALYALSPGRTSETGRTRRGGGTRRAGRTGRRALFAPMLTPPVAAAEACGRTPRSATSRRTAPAAARSVGRRASRERRRRAARARRASRRCSPARRSR